MGDIRIGDIDITTLIVVSSVLIVLPIQLLLCFKVRKLLFRLLPAIALTLSTAFLFAMSSTSRDWDAVGYLILGIYSGVLLTFCGLGWTIWGLAVAIKNRRKK